MSTFIEHHRIFPLPPHDINGIFWAPSLTADHPYRIPTWSEERVQMRRLDLQNNGAV